MSAETASQEGGKIRLGVLPKQSLYVLGVAPKLTGEEMLGLLDNDFLPAGVLEGSDYSLVFYRGRDFPKGDRDPDAPFASFALEASRDIGERVLSNEVKCIVQ